MNLVQYIDTHIHRMSYAKIKAMRRKAEHKLEKLAPRLLEAKLMGRSEHNKIFRYEERLTRAIKKLDNEVDRRRRSNHEAWTDQEVHHGVRTLS